MVPWLNFLHPAVADINNDFHWSRETLTQALKVAGIVPGDTIFVQVSLGMLGRLRNAATAEDLCATGLDAILDAVSPNGTVVTPTYSYSFCKGEEFCLQTTSATIGPFAEHARAHVDAIRSNDPIFSVVSIGPAAEDLITNLPYDCFGSDSIYGRLVAGGAKIVTIGVGLAFSTFRHHAEQDHGVPFRYLKQFSGTVRDGDVVRSETWTYLVRFLGDPGLPDAWNLEEKARSDGIVTVAPCGRGEVWVADAGALKSFIERALDADPWATARGPVVDVEKMEMERMGVPEINIQLPDNDDPLASILTLSDIPRSLVSPYGNAAIEALAKRFDLQLLRLATGQRFGDFVVPESRYEGGASSCATATGYSHLPLAFAAGEGGVGGPVFLADLGDSGHCGALYGIMAATILVNRLKKYHGDGKWTVVITPGSGAEAAIEALFPGPQISLGRADTSMPKENIDIQLIKSLVEKCLSHVDANVN